MSRLLVIDDDYSLFALLSEYLGNSGFQCTHAADGDAGVSELARGSWDAVILDVMLPGKDGHEVLRCIRSNPATSTLPVLMLTARGEEDDKVIGLELGADDYLGKPFGPKELVARLRALLRRTRQVPPSSAGDGNLLKLDDLVIDRLALLLIRADGNIEITASELRLLELLAKTPGEVVDRNTLYRDILGHPPFAQDRSLDMMVSRLRKKLGPQHNGKDRIRAERGQGYVFLASGGK